MPADIINLRQARKQKARAAHEQRAIENRVKFGRSAAMRKWEARVIELDTRRLDGTRRNRDGQDQN